MLMGLCERIDAKIEEIEGWWMGAGITLQVADMDSMVKMSRKECARFVFLKWCKMSIRVAAHKMICLM